jgi:zinc transport system substrate-binding protein
MFFRKILILLAAISLLAGCKDDSKSADKKNDNENKPMLIYTSIQPIAFIASKIAGRYAEVKSLIPPGKTPHSFSLVPGDLKKISKAQFFFSVRLPFEEMKLEKAFKDSKTKWVDITRGVKFLPIESCCDHDHDHDHEHENQITALELMDSHIWLDPLNDLIMARNICNTLSNAMPEHAQYFELNFQSFRRCLVALDKKLKKMLEPHKGKAFLVYHPAFGYFAKRYGLRQEPVELGGKSPTPQHLQKVIDLALKKNINIIFVQPEFNRKAAKLIAKAINGAVIKLDPLAYNLIDNYITFATKIQAAIKNDDVKKEADEK